MELTYWGQKNGAMLQAIFYKCIILTENCCIQFSLVPDVPADYNLALVQVMVRRRSDDKPLPGPMMTWFTDRYMHQ